MKKYRLTKITVKTREIVSLSKDSFVEKNHVSICPVCHAPISSSLPAAEMSIEKQPAMLLPAENSEDE